MAPTKSPKRSNKSSGKKPLGPSKDSSSRVSKSSSAGGKVRRPPPTQQKTKPASAHAAANKKKQKKVYTDAELGIPKLNMITPIGVEKPKGKKKGKVFVDDPESMMTIMAMVNAEKDGQIESKMIKARQMEEIREARRKEAERREEERKGKLEDVKDGLRKRRGRKGKGDGEGAVEVDEVKTTDKTKPMKKKGKRVSFG